MKFFSLLSSICFLVFFSSYAVDTTTINYNDFSDISAWQLNRSARGMTNSDQKKVLRLTSNTTSQSGSAFIKNPIQLISDKGFMASFSAYFSFQISNTGGLDEGDGAGADGLVFVIQTVANNVGSLGGGLGYRGLHRSIGIEFDTWNNPDSSQDPDHNHMGIDTNGNTQSIITCSEKTLFNNGNIWYAWIDYDGDNQLLEVRYDSLNVRPDTPKLSQKINIPSLLVQENAYIGFTSATGLSYNTHDILSINFVNKFQPYLYSLSLSASPDTVVNVYDSILLLSTIRDMSNNVQPDSAKKTEWRIIDAGGNPSSILKSNSGSEVLVIPENANSQIKIEGKAVINGQTLIDTISIRVKQTDAYSLEVISTPDTIVKSHGKVTLQSRVYDAMHNQLSDSAQKTSWKIISADGNPENVLQSTIGASVDLIPQIPYSLVIIEATVNIKNQKLVDTIQIHVTAGDPYRLVIEKEPIPKREANPLERLTLSTFPANDSVYAVVRDRWGGYCSLADSVTTNWQVVSGKNIITATGTDHRKYLGQIKRSGPQGEALIEVSDGNLIKDSLLITTENLYFDKIVIRDGKSGNTLDSVIAKVKQLRSLEVYGLIAGCDPKLGNSWMLVNADWSLSGSLTSVGNPLPKGSERWDLIANTAGQGILTVKNGTHENSIPVTIVPQTAPYLTRAIYYPSNGSNSKGVIKLYFSEDVDLKMLSAKLPENTLLYTSSVGKSTKQIFDGASYIDIPANQFFNTITVQVGSGADNIVPNLDSVSIIDGTVNKNGIGPEKQNAKKVPVEIQGGNISVAISSNPFNLQEPVTKLSNKITSFYDNVLKNNNGFGAIIAVHSSIPLKLVGGSYGTAMIYDAVGNIVCQDLEVKLANNNTKTDYGIYWDGTNKNRRAVGRGTYLAKIKVTDINEIPHMLSIKIGVIDKEPL